MGSQIVDETEGEPVTGFLSDLARMREDAEAVEFPPLRLKHPTIPGYVLQFRTDLDSEEDFKPWRKASIIKAAKNGKPEEVDRQKFARLIVAGSCELIEKDDKVVTDSKGNPVNFRSKEFLTAMDVGTAADAVWAFIRKDAAIQSLGDKVIDASGWGEEAEEATPKEDD